MYGYACADLFEIGGKIAVSLYQFLFHYLYFVVQMVSSELFQLVFPMLMAFASIIGCVSIIRYLVSLKR